MSDLFRSALGYLSSGSVGSAGQQGQGGYQSTSAPSDETNAVGEVVTFSTNRSVRITKLIAEGGFSYVFKGVDLQSGEIVAVKKILAPDAEAKKAVLQEREFHGQFQHPHIAKFYGSFVKAPNPRVEEHYIAMEFCPTPLPTPPLRLQHATQVFAQVCKSIKYLHDFGIVHRDIKLENVLIGSDGLTKLVDFGSATMEKFYPTPDWSMNKRTLVEEQLAAKTTPMYRAPEMLDLWMNYPIDEKVDLWALGCLLFALSYGSHPFQDSNKLAITNANYSLPKNVGDSGPVVEIIRGLLKVDPRERLSFGRVFDILQSIAESQGFSLNGPLPFKPAANSPITISADGGGGIVNPMANLPPQHSSTHSTSAAGGGSLFHSLKGGAVSLIKNIKEQSQQYLGPGYPVGGGSQSAPATAGRGEREPPQQSQPLPSRPPPPRPPPSPLMNQRKNNNEFENRHYEAMNVGRDLPPERPAPPRPQRPPSPRVERKEHEPPRPPPPQPQPKIGNLLDMSFDLGSSSPAAPAPPQVPSNAVPSSNADLLDDLFGSSGGSGSNNGGKIADDNLDFWGAPSQPQPQNTAAPEVDLLGDPLASLLGKSAPPIISNFNNIPQHKPGFAANFAPSQPQPQPFLQTNAPGVMPQSASFQNLNFQQPSNLLSSSAGEGKMPKNSSSPNLLSDLILDDLMGLNVNATAASSTSGGNSNPTLSSNNKPNYNRTQIFTEQEEQKPRTNLNDVFGDILNSQGFSSSKDQSGRSINEMRKVEALSNPNANPTQIKVNEWKEGKKKNIRALLSSLHTITWEGCNWGETNMSQMITPVQVKKVYRKACLAIHPDKQMGEEWEELAKLIFVELNEAWAAFEESQQ